MKVFIVIKDPWNEIIGIYRNIKDAQDMINSFKDYEKFSIEEHQLIE